MKKIISLVAIAAMMLAMAGCAVNANTGAITVTNFTTKAANNVKVGKVYIGYVGAGATTTVYFSTEETDATITVDGFSKPTILKGTIDLKKNFLYRLDLDTYTAGDYFACTGYKNGYNASLPAVSDIISMK